MYTEYSSLDQYEWRKAYLIRLGLSPYTTIACINDTVYKRALLRPINFFMHIIPRSWSKRTVT